MLRLQNKYQDGQWENLDDDCPQDCDSAIRKAQQCSTNAIIYGMVRVVDGQAGVLATFTAGHEA